MSALLLGYSLPSNQQVGARTELKTISLFPKYASTNLILRPDVPSLHLTSTVGRISAVETFCHITSARKTPDCNENSARTF